MNSLDTPGTGFADRSLVREYLQNFALPSIHDNIGTLLARVPVAERQGALDLGACTGLITLRAALIGFTPVVGIEPRTSDVQVFNDFLKRPNTRIINEKVDVMSDMYLAQLAQLVRYEKLTTVIARRILPEILGGSVDPKDINTVHPEAGPRLGRALLDGGATRIIIEGRVPSPRARHDLSSVEQEIVALSRHWAVSERLKACAVLIPR